MSGPGHRLHQFASTPAHTHTHTHTEEPKP
jgi:hypothetical protein